MMTSDDKVGGWVKKGQNHDDVILERSIRVKDIWHGFWELFWRVKMGCNNFWKCPSFLDYIFLQFQSYELGYFLNIYSSNEYAIVIRIQRQKGFENIVACIDISSK